MYMGHFHRCSSSLESIITKSTSQTPDVLGKGPNTVTDPHPLLLPLDEDWHGAAIVTVT